MGYEGVEEADKRADDEIQMRKEKRRNEKKGSPIP
jgi:hypothetical protein